MLQDWACHVQKATWAPCGCNLHCSPWCLLVRMIWLMQVHHDWLFCCTNCCTGLSYDNSVSCPKVLSINSRRVVSWCSSCITKSKQKVDLLKRFPELQLQLWAKTELVYFRRSSAEAGGIARRTSMDDDTDVAMGATLEEEIITVVQNKSR